MSHFPLNREPLRYQPHLTALIETLEAKGVLSTPALKQAFASMPRHHFLQQVYLQQGPGPAWQMIQASAQGEEHWLAMVYEDKALVTHVDAAGRPSSSSSQPSAMACMLAALEVQPGQRMLEIGAGTGYNAALLAHLTGDLHLVTTVEIDPEVAQQAQQALDTVLGPGVLVHTGNGLEGYVPHAPYDRLIATGSHPFVPLAWLEQLQVGGRLVMNVRGDLGGGFLQVQKVEPGYRARGTFFALPAVQFMALQEDTPAVQGSLPPREYLTWPLLEQSTFTEASFAPALLEDLDFLCFLQWSFPEGRVVWIQHHPTEMFYPYVFDEGERTMVRLEPVGRSGEWQAEVRGRYPLWTSIQHTAQLWLRLGRPAPSDYALEIDAEGRQDIVLPRPTKERVSSLRWNLYPRDHRR